MLTLLTLAAVVVALLLTAFIVGNAIGRTGRDKLRSELANARIGLADALRQIGFLRELADEREEKYQHMRGIAGEALKIAHKQEFPEREPFTLPCPPPSEWPECPFDFNRVAPNIILANEKWCPECSVSVRSESWPQICPSCNATFGFEDSAS